jgi:WD40 repeat protein
MTSGVEDISFHPQDSVLAVLRPGNLIQLWNLSSGKLEKTIKPLLDNVNGIQFNRDGKLLFAINYREVKILRTRSGRQIGSFNPSAGISIINPFIDFSADGKTLILQSDNNFAFLNFNLESLLKRICEITRDYLKNNPSVSEQDRHICVL